jgi:hypothetical protein
VVAQAARQVTYTAPPVDDDDKERVLAWGRQLDIKTIHNPKKTVRDDLGQQKLSPEQVAGYVAKYATKDADTIRHPGQPRPHLITLGQTVHSLAQRAREHARATSAKEPSPYTLLSKWRHMYGFRGHFSTKSRRYSVTLGKLRRARHRYQQLKQQARQTGQPLDTRNLEARLLADEQETTLVVGLWAYSGSGWTRPADQKLALAAAARAREHHQWKTQSAKARPLTIEG